MDFGKLPDISAVNFTLPQDPAANAAVLEKLPRRIGKPKAYIGATGWGVKEWVGKVYPAKAKSADFLRHYARQFNTIELNTTHYRIPDEATIHHWYDETTPDFRFCPKVLQTISHQGIFDLGFQISDFEATKSESRNPKSEIERFCSAVSGLHEKMGCCFIQLPPYFKPDKLAALENFLKIFSQPFAVEVRHESWFNDPTSFDTLFQMLENHGVSTVITDVAGRRDVAHMRLTTGTVLVRFVGNNLHPIDFSRLDAWAQRLGDWFSKGLHEVYFFTHGPENLLAPELAIYLAEKLRSLGVETRAPVLLDKEEGKQMTLF
ncbi:MAG: DUF72 domain-containing protein [Bacteroidota bacterium]